MAKAGRPKGSGKGVKFTDAHRDKIKNSNVLTALIQHAEGEREMKASQVTAGLGLLGFAYPKMTESMVKGPGENGEFVFKVKFE